MEGNYLSRNSPKEDSFSFEEHPWGTSWPASNYACSFCKREFRSAQALGGHMNVHRRDRARLRSSLSSWVPECPKPNPSSSKPNNNNPIPPISPSSSSPSPLSDEIFMNCCQHRSPFYNNSPCLTLSSSSLPSLSGDKKPRLEYSSPQLPHLLMSTRSKEIKNTRSALRVEELKGCDEEEEEAHKSFKNHCNEHNITLELGIGLLKHPKEKLDLELRL